MLLCDEQCRFACCPKKSNWYTTCSCPEDQEPWSRRLENALTQKSPTPGPRTLGNSGRGTPPPPGAMEAGINREGPPRGTPPPGTMGAGINREDGIDPTRTTTFLLPWRALETCKGTTRRMAIGTMSAPRTLPTRMPNATCSRNSNIKCRLGVHHMVQRVCP